MWIRNLEFTSDAELDRNDLKFKYSNVICMSPDAIEYLLEGRHVRYFVWEEFQGGRFKLFDYLNERGEETICDISTQKRINLLRYKEGDNLPSFSDEFWALRWDADELLETDPPNILRDMIFKKCFGYSVFIDGRYNVGLDMLLLKRPELENRIQGIVERIFDRETAYRIFKEKEGPLDWTPYDSYLNLIFHISMSIGKKTWILDQSTCLFKDIIDKIIKEFSNTQFIIVEGLRNPFTLTEF